MNNNTIPILNFTSLQLIQINWKESATTVQFWHNPTNLLPALGSYLYLTLEAEYLGCFQLNAITTHSLIEIELRFSDIATAILENNELLSTLIVDTNSLPFNIGGTNEGSLSHWNQNPETILCFPLIGYQKWPTNKPTNLPLNYLPPAIRINPLLAYLSNTIGIGIAPISENLLLPYFQSTAVQWPWEQIAQISFNANNDGLEVESELGIISVDHTSLKRKYRTSFLANYEITASLNLQLENTGTTTNTGLAFISITDPTETLLKHQAIISYNLDPNSNATYPISITGDGIESDVLSIHLEPDISLENLNFNFEGTVIPVPNIGFSLAKLLSTYTLSSLLKLVATTTGKTWQWNNYHHHLELVPEQETKYSLPETINADAIITQPISKAVTVTSESNKVKTFTQYLHLNSISTLSLDLPSSRSQLAETAEVINYVQPKFLVIEPASNNSNLLVEGYPVSSFVPLIVEPLVTPTIKTQSVELTYTHHHHEISNLLKSNLLTWKTNPYKIASISISPIKEITKFKYQITAKILGT